MNKDRLNGTAKLDLVARLTRMFAPADATHPNHGHGLSQHATPAADPGRWIVRHDGPNYGIRRRHALANRTRDRRRRLSETQLAPTANRPYVRPANRQAGAR